MSNIHYIDLDEVRDEIDFTVKFGGEEYKVKPITVADFIAEAKQIEELGLGASVKDEVEVSINMLVRALPGMTAEKLKNVNFKQLDALRDFVMKANQQVAAEKAAEETEGNAEAVS